MDHIKDFTLCHDNDRHFLQSTAVYQTATPKIYTQKALREKQREDWVVRNMDDQSVFGPDLFRRSYRDAVNNEWLSDYRIIAVGISGAESHEVANALASATESKGRNPLTSTHFLRGLAFTLAMGGATKGSEDERNQYPVLHRLYEHRRQVRQYGKGAGHRTGQGLAPRPDAGNGYRQVAGSVHPRPPGRQKQRNEAGRGQGQSWPRVHLRSLMASSNVGIFGRGD